MGGICGTRVSVCSACITTGIVLTVLLEYLVATNVNHIATGTTPHVPALSGAEGEVAGEVEDSLGTMTTADPTGTEIETVRNAMMMNTAPQEVVAVALLTIDSMPIGTEDIVTHPKMPMGYLASHSIPRHPPLLR